MSELQETNFTRLDGQPPLLHDSPRANGTPSGAPPVSRTVEICLLILTVILLLGALYVAKAMLMPVALSLILALVLRPVVRGARRLGAPNVVSATLLFLAVVGMLMFAALFLLEPAREWVAEAPRSLHDVSERLKEFTTPIEDLKRAQEEVNEMTKSPGEEEPVSVRLEQPALTSEFLNTTGSYAASAVITVSLLYLLLIFGDRFVEKTAEIVPTWRGRREVLDMIREVESRISRYLGAITLVNAGLGLVIGLGLWAIGMPNAALWGVLAAFLNYIPFAGLAAGTLIVGFAGLVSFEDPAHAMLAPLIYLGANGVEANVITPMVLGQSVDLNPVVILLAVLLGGWLWGIVGIFLSVPVLIIAKIISESYESLRPMAVYLGK